MLDGLTLEEAMDIIKENSQKEPKNYWDLPKTPETLQRDSNWLWMQKSNMSIIKYINVFVRIILNP